MKGFDVFCNPLLLCFIQSAFYNFGNSGEAYDKECRWSFINDGDSVSVVIQVLNKKICV